MLPWRNTTRIDQRRAFIAEWREGEETVSALAASFGVSRKTAYKIINRFQELGEEGLLDRNSAPRSSPRATPPEIAERIIDAKRKDPKLGPKKIVGGLQTAHPGLPWPAPSTAGVILDRAGLVRRRRRPRRRTPPWDNPFRHVLAPNDSWSADFKGWVRTANGVRIDPLVLQDSDSRYILACDALTRPTFEHVRPVFERAFREHGLPLVLRTDNGPPFASTALGGLSRLSVWLVKLGVLPERTQPGHPEQNGRIERFNRTLGEDTLSPPEPTPQLQQRVFDAYVRYFNHERPHEALGQLPPATLYLPSPRPYPRRVEDPVYDVDVIVRQVRTNGEIKWGGERIYLSEALTGERVGLVQRDDRSWTLRFGPLEIGVLDDAKKRILPTPTTVLPM